MRWIEGKIEAKSECADIITALLLDFGIEGVEIVNAYENARFIEENPANWDYVDDSLVDVGDDGLCLLKFYLTGDAENCLPAIAATLAKFGRVESRVVDDDWSEAWKQHYKPFKIGNKIVVVPVWEHHAAKDDEIVFKIDPGHVFGTGQHQSTALCIQLLEKHVVGGENVLDIGCGSGILSIISLLLGANHATAIDIDPQAAKMTVINAELNNIPPEKLNALCGNILSDEAFAAQMSQNKYEIITANIVADIIIALAPIAKKILSDGGKFIVGGIIDDRASEVASALKAVGLKVLCEIQQDNWVAITAQS